MLIVVSQMILKFQSPTTGLFPVESGQNSRIGDVRTSIYCAISIWSLHLAFRKIHNDETGKTFILAQTAVKTMRGILSCWMYQIDKVSV